jgi:2-keto-4-pentenoate hydratase
VKQIDVLTARYPNINAEAAYEIAEAICNLRVERGEWVVGRKIGFTNSSLLPVYGVDAPIWGYMYDTTVHPAKHNHTLSLSKVVDPKIEPEVVFCLRRVPTAGSDESEILKCIEWIAHGFEIVQSHYPKWKFTAADAIAAGSLHGSLLLGEPVQVDELGTNPIEVLANFSVSIFCNEELREIGRGTNVLGNPLTALKHLIHGVHTQRGSAALSVGDIVTTGTLTAAFPIKPGETWRTEISGIALSNLRVTFE